MLAPHLANHPLPERNGLRVRVVDAEDGYPALDPEQDDVEQCLPQPLPVLRLEVDVVDVLVLLGRVLRVLQRAVRPPVEPLRMLREPRMVRGALDREVECDLDARVSRGGDHRLEVLPRAEVAMDRVVPAVLRADRPWRTDVVRLRRQRVVAALAVRAADRVDRRQVDDVEAERRGLRQHVRDAAEAAPRTREDLVPRAEAREHTVDVDLVGGRGRLAVTVSRVGGQPLLRGDGAAEQLRALGELTGEVILPRLDLAADLVLPRGDPIGPRGDLELPPTGPVGRERAAPAVVAEVAQRLLRPGARARPLDPHR